MKIHMKLIAFFLPLLLIASFSFWETGRVTAKRFISSLESKKTVAFVWRENEKELKVVIAKNDLSLKKEDFLLKDEEGKTYEIQSLKEEEQSLILKTELSPEKQYLLSYKDETQYVYPSMNYLNENFYYQGPLGLYATKKKIDFFLWSPTASKINFRLFDSEKSIQPLLILPMKKGEKGLWTVSFENKKYAGFLYDLEVTAFGKTALALDPYALNMAPFKPSEKKVAKSFIVLREDLENHHKKKSNAEILDGGMDFVGYETHVRDFSIDPDLVFLPKKERGTFTGMMRLTPYLKELGITHVQLLPVFNYATVDETQKEFQGFDTETSKINYNWGYDTHHYFSLEGWLSTHPESATYRIKEFQNLVASFHHKNMGVIVDVVYNHIYDQDIFETVAPGCYFRRNDRGEISYHTGAGASFESRMLMMQRLIIDSLKHLRDVYHVNGVRFDLMGFIDIETMKKAKAELGEDFILYGEGWDFTDLPPHLAPTKSNVPQDFYVGLFNDTSRDAYTGAGKDVGLIQGAFHQAPKAKAGLIAGIQNYPRDYDQDGKEDVFMSEDRYQLFAPLPQNTMNYLTIHDGLTLWDKINLSLKASASEKKNLMKMAFALLMTSQGRVILHGGDEFGRSKPLSKNDPEKQRALTSSDVIPEKGISYFHENSYRSPDFTNMFDWKRLKEFKEVRSYLKGLIDLRKHIKALHYETPEDIQKGFRFVSERMPENTQAAPGPYKNFEQLDQLQIQFKNGPKGKTLYIVGEIFGADFSDKNPKENPYAISFDEKGEGSILLSRATLLQLDLKAWSDPDNFQFKLVFKPTEWISPEGSYSSMGNNSILPKAISADFKVDIDLGVVDNRAGEKPLIHAPTIAYIIDSKLADTQSPYRSLLVIHNASEKSETLKIKELSRFKEAEVLVDKEHSGITPLRKTTVLVKGESVTVPSKSSTVIGLN